MHEAGILPSDDILVNEQKIGRLEGFRLALSSGGASLLQEARSEITPILEQEYSLQAERFAAAPNGSIAIGQDSFVRWRGQVIAKLRAGEDILRPQFVLLADEALNTPAREMVEARVARFINFHFETALKPLYDLAAAEALFEKPRFIALRLVEHLGIVPRHDIASQVRELDQDSRAALRRLGVRFGVYHIFVPLLLKPIAAQALTFLWALKYDAQERLGYGDIISYLSAGRTSFAVEEGFDRNFYRLAGYRILGKKAVRVDMLERCADLIRHAVSWRPGKTETVRPEGAYDGRHFTISQAMLSILGTTSEDMEEVLKQLGYVAHRINETEYKNFFMNVHKAVEGTENVPQAEPVGDWPQVSLKVAEPVDDQQGKTATAEISEAEPVGPKFRGIQSAKTSENNTILLWRYQKRTYKKPHHRQASKAAGKSFARQDTAPATEVCTPEKRQERKPWEKRGSGHRDFAKKPEKQGFSKKNAGERPRNFTDKKRHKVVNIEDSPFAALAVLRDKLKK